MIPETVRANEASPVGLTIVGEKKSGNSCTSPVSGATNYVGWQEQTPCQCVSERGSECHTKRSAPRCFSFARSVSVNLINGIYVCVVPM